MGQWLRAIDPATGEPLPDPEEWLEALQAAEARAVHEARARQAADERAARAEADARRLEEERQRLLAELARLRGDRGGSTSRLSARLPRSG